MTLQQTKKRIAKVYPHEWLFKCVWRSTAVKIKVGATNLNQAELRAWGTVSRMEGGNDCLEVKLIQQLR